MEVDNVPPTTLLAEMEPTLKVPELESIVVPSTNTLDVAMPVRLLPSIAGSFPDPSNLTNWFIPLNVLPCVVTTLKPTVKVPLLLFNVTLLLPSPIEKLLLLVPSNLL